MRRRFPPPAQALTLLAIAAFAGAGARGLQAAAQSGREPEAGEPEAPRLVLTASPRLGFPPLEVALTATLYGVSKDDERFCHVDRVWTLRIDPDSRSRLRNSSERPRCHHPEGEVKVEMRYYTDKVLRSPGLYHYQLTLEPKQGPPLRSNPITVQVLAGK